MCLVLSYQDIATLTPFSVYYIVTWSSVVTTDADLINFDNFILILATCYAIFE